MGQSVLALDLRITLILVCLAFFIFIGFLNVMHQKFVFLVALHVRVDSFRLLAQSVIQKFLQSSISRQSGLKDRFRVFLLLQLFFM